MKAFLKRLVLIVATGVLWPVHGTSENYYVSLQGNDGSSGSLASPFRTIEKAIGVAISGDTIFVRGGTYPLTATIRIQKSGTPELYLVLVSFPGERAMLDFTGQAMGSRGITLSGSYWQIEGFDIFGSGDNGLKIEGGNWNRIVKCAFYRNRDSGLQMGQGASYNQVINCDSYFNADPPDYGDADGFAAKMDVGIENYYYGCRAWLNCDDGWDGYMRGADNASTIIVNSWAFENGYLEDGSDPGSQANGNGFKMGGSDDKTLSHDFTLHHCLAFKNKSKGFDQNSNMGSMILYNCTGHGNLNGNYVIYKTLASGKELILKNCAVLGPLGNLAAWAVQDYNSWNLDLTVTEADFVSVDDNAAYGPRQADGSLPEIPYLHLAEGSALIDAGIDVGLPYMGAAPDLGCFESEFSNPGVSVPSLPDPAWSTCYPNPASEMVTFVFSSGATGGVSIDILDLSGRITVHADPGSMQGSSMTVSIPLPSMQAGLYLYRISIGGKTAGTGKLQIR
jgi:hypothetical protein